jgi:hypothetical protein
LIGYLDYNAGPLWLVGAAAVSKKCAEKHPDCSLPRRHAAFCIEPLKSSDFDVQSAKN